MIMEYESKSASSIVQYVGRDALRNPFRCLVHRIAREMRVARRGLDTRVTEQFPDHGESLAQRQGARGEGVPKIMNRKLAAGLRP